MTLLVLSHFISNRSFGPLDLLFSAARLLIFALYKPATLLIFTSFLSFTFAFRTPFYAIISPYDVDIAPSLSADSDTR